MDCRDYYSGLYSDYCGIHSLRTLGGWEHVSLMNFI